MYSIKFYFVRFSIPVCVCLQTTTENFIYSTYTVMFVDPDLDPTKWFGSSDPDPPHWIFKTNAARRLNFFLHVEKKISITALLTVDVKIITGKYLTVFLLPILALLFYNAHLWIIVTVQNVNCRTLVQIEMQGPPNVFWTMTMRTTPTTVQPSKYYRNAACSYW